MRAVGQADRSRTARDFLHGDAMLEITESGAAIFFLDRNAVKTERAKPRPEIARELVGLVDLGCTRRDLIRGKIANRLADRIGGLAKIEIEGTNSIGNGHESLPQARSETGRVLSRERPCHGEVAERRAGSTAFFRQDRRAMPARAMRP